MSEIGPAKRCGLYLPGHEVNWIQAKKSWKDREGRPLACRFVQSRGDGMVVIELDDQELHLWNHEPERLARSVASADGIVSYQKPWSLLITGDGGYFSVASPPEDYVPCPEKPPTGAPLEVLRSAGGVTLPLGPV